MSDPVSGAMPRWRVKHGLIAIAICVLCAEGVCAGLDRPCMPSFDLGILAGQMLLLNIFFAPELAGLLAGVPAFVIAASPFELGPRTQWLSMALLAVAGVSLGVTATVHSTWSTLPLLGVVVGYGALVGFGVRRLHEIRRLWLPFGILLALTVGSVIFAFGHYGHNNCWP